MPTIALVLSAAATGAAFALEAAWPLGLALALMLCVMIGAGE
jgi:hypothetical protein